MSTSTLEYDVDLKVLRQLFNEREWTFLMSHPTFVAATDRLKSASDHRIQTAHDIVALALDLVNSQRFNSTGAFQQLIRVFS